MLLSLRVCPGMDFDGIGIAVSEYSQFKIYRPGEQLLRGGRTCTNAGVAPYESNGIEGIHHVNVVR